MSYVTQSPGRSHALPLLEQLHWLPVHQWIEYKLAVLTFKIRHSSTPAYLARHIRSRQISRRFRSSDTPLLHKPTPELTLPTMLSVVLLLQSGIHLAMSLSLVLHLLYLSLPLRHSYSVRHLCLVGSHDRNLSVSASGVFDILALYKLDYYYYHYCSYYYYYNYYKSVDREKLRCIE